MLRAKCLHTCHNSIDMSLNLQQLTPESPTKSRTDHFSNNFSQAIITASVIYLQVQIMLCFPFCTICLRQWRDDTEVPKVPRLRRRVLHGVHNRSGGGGITHPLVIEYWSSALAVPQSTITAVAKLISLPTVNFHPRCSTSNWPYIGSR